MKQIIEYTISEKGNDCDRNFINTSKITDMSFLFQASKFNGDISDWDVSKIVCMSSMFEGSKFKGDVSKWNLTSIKNVDFMFDDCPLTRKYGDTPNDC